MNIEELKSKIITLNFYLEDNELSEMLYLNSNYKNSFIKDCLNLTCKLHKFLKSNDIPELDYELFVENQFTDKKTDCASNSLTSIDFELSFLLYLFLDYKKLKNMKLADIIDSYLRRIKSSLRFHDIQRTKTGSVRCKTNIRFTLNVLRYYGLIKYRDKDFKRKWELTFSGFLICAYVLIAKPFPLNKIINKLKERTQGENDFRGFQILFEMFFAKGGFNQLIESLKGSEFNERKTLWMQLTLLDILITTELKYKNIKKLKSGFEYAKYIEALNSIEMNRAIEFLKTALNELGNMRLLEENAYEILTVKE